MGGAINRSGEIAWWGPDPDNGNYEVFLYKPSTGVVRNLSNTPEVGETAVAISDNGDVAWHCYSYPAYQVYVFRRAAENVVQVSQASSTNAYPSLLDINSDGDILWVNKVYSYSPYKVDSELYIHHRATEESTLVTTDYVRYASLSDNGDVAYLGGWSNSESNVYLYKGSTNSVVALTTTGEQWEPEINARGDVTWYGGYTTPMSGWDIFFYDSLTAEIEQLTSDGSTGTLHYYPQINEHGDVTWIQHDYTYDARIFLAVNGVPIQVNIQPGAEGSCLRNDGHGVIPVAILGEIGLDVRAIDPQTVHLETLSAKMVGSNRPLVNYEDVNGDGIEDLVVQIEDSEGVLEAGTNVVRITALLNDGTLLEGSDSICVLGRESIAWAVSATASSEWSATAWSASQATGEPDTFSCGDSPTAWAPAPSGTEPEWLKVDFGESIRAKGLVIHETFESGFITQVDLIDGNGISQTIWTGIDTTNCPGWFELNWGSPFKSVRAVKISTQKDGWEEIDAVGLVVAP